MQPGHFSRPPSLMGANWTKLTRKKRHARRKCAPCRVTKRITVCCRGPFARLIPSAQKWHRRRIIIDQHVLLGFSRCTRPPGIRSRYEYVIMYLSSTSLRTRTNESGRLAVFGAFGGNKWSPSVTYRPRTEPGPEVEVAGERASNHLPIEDLTPFICTLARSSNNAGNVNYEVPAICSGLVGRIAGVASPGPFRLIRESNDSPRPGNLFSVIACIAFRLILRFLELSSPRRPDAGLPRSSVHD